MENVQNFLPSDIQKKEEEAKLKLQREKELIVQKRDRIEKQLQAGITRIQAMLPKGAMVERFIQVVLNSCLKNPLLLECTPGSILGACMQSAQLGLTPDGVTGEAHLIPFKNTKKGNIYEAQFIPGYKGLIQLAIRTGQVKRFQARVVYKGDIFEYELGATEKLRHIPTGESEEITFFYAVIEFTNGGVMFDVLPVKQVEKIRDNSPNYKFTPDQYKKSTIWGKNFAEMGMKTMIRRLAKYAPISPEFQRAVSLDSDFEEIGRGQDLQLNLMDGANKDEINDLIYQTVVNNTEDYETAGNEAQNKANESLEAKDKAKKLNDQTLERMRAADGKKN